MTRSQPDLNHLRQLFPPTRLLPEEIDGCAPELFDYRRDFGGRTWAEVTPDRYEAHIDAFCLMAPATLKHYIAGFLHQSISRLESNSCEFLVHFSGSDGFLSLYAELTADQAKFTISAIDWILSLDDGFSDEDRERYYKMRDLAVKRHVHGG